MYVSGDALLLLMGYLGFQTCHFEAAATVTTPCSISLGLDAAELMQVAPRQEYPRSSVLQTPSVLPPLKYIIVLL